MFNVKLQCLVSAWFLVITIIDNLRYWVRCLSCIEVAACFFIFHYILHFGVTYDIGSNNISLGLRLNLLFYKFAIIEPTCSLTKCSFVVVSPWCRLQFNLTCLFGRAYITFCFLTWKLVFLKFFKWKSWNVNPPVSSSYSRQSVKPL